MKHFISKIDLKDKPEGYKSVIFGAGCFWGAERKFWEEANIYLTSVGYSGGSIVNPTYEQVCYEDTGHAEVVKVTYDPNLISFKSLLKIFWECHDPTQGNRQGNDIGTQYRSVIYCEDEIDLNHAKESLKQYQEIITNAKYGEITTEIKKYNDYFFAEEYHQQYLAKNPNGYCGIGGTGCEFK